MSIYSNKTQDKRSQSRPNPVSHKQGKGGNVFQFEDNRPEAIAQRKLQEMANTSSRLKQPEHFQIIPNDFSEQPIQKVKHKQSDQKHNRKNKRLAKSLGLHASSFPDSVSTREVLAEAQAEHAEEGFRDETHEKEEVSPVQNIEDVKDKAHGIGAGSAKDITEAQESYQKWLSQQFDMGQIMDTHRSVGYEYEFATYRFAGEEVAIDSHNELGYSNPLSPLFNTPFKIETDAEEELEIVTPPLLIENSGEAINKDAAKILYETFKESAKNLREKNKGKKISKLPLAKEGFSSGWKFNKVAKNIAISPNRTKHETSKDQVYSQMNISLTPEEMADFMDIQSASDDWVQDYSADVLEGTDIFSRAYFRIKNLLDDEGEINEAINDYFDEIDPDQNIPIEQFNLTSRDIKDKIEKVNILISRSLGNAIAIPSIVFNEEFRDKELFDSLHSGVKETFGIWVKDTIQSVISSMVSGEGGTRVVSAKLLNSSQGGILQIIREELLENHAGFPRLELMFEEDRQQLEERMAELTLSTTGQVENEVRATLGSLISLLKDEPIAEFDYQTEFLDESFEEGQAGFGVRKDTFVPIDSGDNTDLHLAEIRNDDSIEEFLK